MKKYKLTYDNLFLPNDLGHGIRYKGCCYLYDI